MAPSADCHFHWTSPNSSHSLRSSAHRCSNRSHLTHRVIARWTDESSPNSLGNSFHWHPVRPWWISPFRAARSSDRGRPVRFGGSCFSISTATRSHTASGTRQIVGSGWSSTPVDFFLRGIRASCFDGNFTPIRRFEMVSKSTRCRGRRWTTPRPSVSPGLRPGRR